MWCAILYYMDTLIHADIFFFVTTIAVVVVAAVFTVALFYLVAVLRQVRDIASEIKEEAKLMRADIGDARTRIKTEGFRLKHLFDFFSQVGARKEAKKRSQK